MNVPREQISVALFNLLSTNPQLTQLVKTFSRVPRPWQEVPTSERPYLLLFKGGPQTEGYVGQEEHPGLTRYVIHYNLWLYLTSDPAKKITAETAINNIADGIDNAFQTRSNGQPIITNRGERQTLGGIVTNAYLVDGSEWGREFDDNNVVICWLIAVQTGL